MTDRQGLFEKHFFLCPLFNRMHKNAQSIDMWKDQDGEAVMALECRVHTSSLALSHTPRPCRPRFSTILNSQEPV